MNASTIMAPNPKTRIPPNTGIVKRTCLIRANFLNDRTEFHPCDQTRLALPHNLFYSAAQEHIVDQTRIPYTNGQESHGRPLWPQFLYRIKV